MPAALRGQFLRCPSDYFRSLWAFRLTTDHCFDQWQAVPPLCMLAASKNRPLKIYLLAQSTGPTHMNDFASRRPWQLAFLVSAILLQLWSPRLAQAQNPAKTSPVAVSDEPARVTIERAFPNLQFQRPIYATFPPDGSNRLAVISQYGKVLIFPTTSRHTELEDLVRSIRT